MAKNIIFKVRKNKKGGFFFSIIAANGKNLDPKDPQTRKRTVQNAIGSFVSKIQKGEYEIKDLTKLEHKQRRHGAGAWRIPSKKAIKK